MTSKVMRSGAQSNDASAHRTREPALKRSVHTLLSEDRTRAMLTAIRNFFDQHIAAQPDELPVPKWQGDLVARRLVEHRADPDAARTLDEVLESIDEKLRTPRR